MENFMKHFRCRRVHSQRPSLTLAHIGIRAAVVRRQRRSELSHRRRPSVHSRRVHRVRVEVLVAGRDVVGARRRRRRPTRRLEHGGDAVEVDLAAL